MRGTFIGISMNRRKRRLEARERKKLEEKLKKDSGSKSPSESLTEKSWKAAATQSLKGPRTTHFQPMPEGPANGHRSRLIQIFVWLFRKSLGFVLGVATLLSLQQFIIMVPEIRPVDFGSGSPYPVMFIVHNPLLLTMYDAQIASMLGPVQEGGKQDLQAPLWRQPGPLNVCQRMLKYPDLRTAAGKFDAFGEVNYETIEPGQDVTFVTGTKVLGNTRAVVAVAVLYSVKPMGLATLWTRTTCSVFQTATDSEGHFHVLPYAEGRSH
jgi:hypothetical protein